MKLTIKQTVALDILEDRVTTELYYGGAAGGAKSVLGCYWILKCCLKYPGTRWLIGRSELKNLKKTTLNSFFEVCKMQGLKSGVHYFINHQDSIIRFSNKSEIVLADLYAYPTDAEFDSLGSLEISGAFVDEAPQIVAKAKNVLKSRIRYKLGEYSLIPKLLMTGNPSKNWAYYDFFWPATNASVNKGWEYLDSQKRKRYDRAFVQAFVTDNPYIDPVYIDSLQGLDKNSRERLLNGNWQYDDDPTRLIEYEKIIDCFTNTGLKQGIKYITADIARYGKDNTVIGIWEGYRVELFSYHGLDVTQSAAKIDEFRIKHGVVLSNIMVDEDGVGGGVKDILKCKGFVNNSVPITNTSTQLPGKPENFVNLKSQCYFRLADRVNTGNLFIKCFNDDQKQKIIEELEQVKQYNMDKDSKRAVMPKDKVKEIIGRSPDFSDTLMMREWFDLTKKREWVAV